MSSSVPRRDRERRPRRTSVDELDEAERGIVQALCKNFGGPVRVFGSRARGNWAEDSDIDVGIVGDFNRAKDGAIITNIGKVHGIKIDAMPMHIAATHKGFEAWA